MLIPSAAQLRKTFKMNCALGRLFMTTKYKLMGANASNHYKVNSLNGVLDQAHRRNQMKPKVKAIKPF